MQLRGVDYVLLGFLADRPGSGYDVKNRVDRSTRFFYAASYGRIYPELHRLEAAGLVKGRDAATGGRQRTEYEVTDEGRRALRRWLAGSPAPLEMRDEGLLKVFFSGEELGVATADKVEAMRVRHEVELAALEALSEDLGDVAPDSSGRLALEYGIALHAFAADWWTSVAERLPEAVPDGAAD